MIGLALGVFRGTTRLKQEGLRHSMPEGESCQARISSRSLQSLASNLLPLTSGLTLAVSDSSAKRNQHTVTFDRQSARPTKAKLGSVPLRS